jgi:cation transport regulator ChaB
MTTSPVSDGPLDPETPTYEIPDECKAVIPAAAQDLLQNIFTRLTTAEKYADALIIQDEKTNTEASTKLAFLSKSQKQLEAKKKELRTPLNQQLNLISAPFNVLLEQIEPINKTLGAKVMRYQDEVDAREKAACEEEQRQIAAALREREAEQKEQAATSDSDLARQDAKDTAQAIKDVETKPVKIQPKRTSTLGGTVGRTKRWTYEVLELKNVPRKYLASVVTEPKKDQQVGHLESGHKLVMADVNKGVREIPGLRIYQKSHVAVR